MEYNVIINLRLLLMRIHLIKYIMVTQKEEAFCIVRLNWQGWRKRKHLKSDIFVYVHNISVCI